MKLLDGRKVAASVLEKAAAQVSQLKQQGVEPKMAVILVGDDPASQVYVKHKHTACEKAGIQSLKIAYTEDEVSTESLVKKIQELNEDESIHGILVQLPLPEHVYTPKVMKAIDPKKDVDGFTAYNIGKMFLSTEFEKLAPCTPKGVIKMLEYYEIPIEGKEAVVVGASNIVGKPMSTMLLNREATVTTCHIKTKDLASHTKRADIIVVAVGKVNLISADMVKKGAVVVDVGINRLDNGKLVGDTDFDALKEKVSYISPVPGGVGPMTVACLVDNLVIAARDLNS